MQTDNFFFSDSKVGHWSGLRSTRMTETKLHIHHMKQVSLEGTFKDLLSRVDQTFSNNTTSMCTTPCNVISVSLMLNGEGFEDLRMYLRGSTLEGMLEGSKVTRFQIQSYLGNDMAYINKLAIRGRQLSQKLKLFCNFNESHGPSYCYTRPLESRQHQRYGGMSMLWHDRSSRNSRGRGHVLV